MFFSICYIYIHTYTVYTYTHLVSKTILCQCSPHTQGERIPTTYTHLYTYICTHVYIYINIYIYRYIYICTVCYNYPLHTYPTGGRGRSPIPIYLYELIHIYICLYPPYGDHHYLCTYILSHIPNRPHGSVDPYPKWGVGGQGGLHHIYIHTYQ